MPSFANSALRLLRRVLGAPERSVGPYAGEQTALDGNTAVAVTEAGIGECAALGASFPADTADLAWRTEQRRHGTNQLGGTLGNLAAGGPRGALAAAMGLALGGTRATVFLSAPDLAAARDLLSAAAGRRLPLVVHLSNRALPGHASAAGSGHEACHLAADAGAFVLFAANVQEAVDYSLIARRVAEQTLTPGLIVMDGEQTALALQDVRLPPTELIQRFLGRPGDSIPVPTPAQRLLFGERRRRIPRWHDPDQPVLLGALQTPESWGLGAAAAATYFGPEVRACLEESITLLARETGRQPDAISTYRTEDAQLILVAQGAAVETAEAVAEHLRDGERLKVGVLGIRCLRPSPGSLLAERLATARDVLVLERLDTPLAGDPPLMRELRAVLDRAAENTHFGAETHAGYGTLEQDKRPRLRSVIYGLGGGPLRGADLIRLCREVDSLEAGRLYLGMDFSPATSSYPKRQVLLDRLRRDYPETAHLGLTATDPTPDLRPAGAMTLAVHRRTGQQAEGLAAEAAGFLRTLVGERLRSRPALYPQPFGAYCIDRFTCAGPELRDPGATTPVDLALLAADPGGIQLDPLADLQSEGALLLLGPDQDAVLWQTLAPALQQALRQTGAALYAVAPPEVDTDDYLLGALCGVLLDKGWIELSSRRLLAAREEQLKRSGDPQQETRRERFQAGLEEVRQVEYANLPANTQPSATPDEEAPAVVRRLRSGEDTYDNLPRFWDQVGVLYHNQETAQLAPDPYLAIGAVPPLSSAFRDLSPLRRELPRLDPGLCTGCGRCWTQCPDGALGAVAATPREALEASIPQAEASALRPVVSKLAERIASTCRTPQGATESLGTLLGDALSWLQEKMAMPDERKQALEAAGERLIAAVGCLPVAVTDPLFAVPEGGSLGTGGLLFLAVNSDTCKGCGICVTTCPEGALQQAPQSPAELEHAQRIWKAWERLPDTSPALIAQAASRTEPGPLAASLLARGTAGALAGGDGAEAGSGERLALRLALAIAETHWAPRRTELLDEVRAVREQVTALIRKILADALPADDLDGLSGALQAVHTRQAELGTFLNQAENAIESAIDAARLRRLVELAQELGELTWRLEEGRHGMGRAALALVVAPGETAGWAGAFPQNPFRIPVTLDPTGDGAELAAGLLESQLRQATEGIVLLRKARLELEKPADAVRLWSSLDALTWQELTEHERGLCPGLLLVGGSRVLAGSGLSQVVRILGSDLPVKMLVLADLDLGLSTRPGLDLAPAPAPDPATNLGLLALAQPGAYIAQTSVGAPEHFRSSLEAGLDYDGPALLHLNAPSPGRHGFAADRTLEQAQLAIESRTFPLFHYDPLGEGVFGSRLSLEGNPDSRASWVAVDEGEEAPTPAHWALGETRFRDYFEPLAEDAPGPLPVDAYLALGEKERRGHTPYVSVQRPDRDPLRYRVAPELVETCTARQQAWRLLQELSGMVTPFTARIQREAEEQVAADHQAALAAQAADYERKLRELRDGLTDELRHDVRERLMALAGYGRQAESDQKH